MLFFEFGKGKLGVASNNGGGFSSVDIYKLKKYTEVGTPFSVKNNKLAVRLIFSNVEGLDVLIKALEECRTVLTFPDHLKLGA